MEALSGTIEHRRAGAAVSDGGFEAADEELAAAPAPASTWAGPSLGGRPGPAWRFLWWERWSGLAPPAAIAWFCARSGAPIAAAAAAPFL